MIQYLYRDTIIELLLDPESVNPRRVATNGWYSLGLFYKCNRMTFAEYMQMQFPVTHTGSGTPVTGPLAKHVLWDVRMGRLRLIQPWDRQQAA